MLIFIPMKRKEIFYLFLIGLIFLVLIEGVLKLIFNIHPGYHHYSQWFREVDSLEIHQGFAADSAGIFKVDASAARFLSARVQSDSMMSLPKNETNKNLEVYGLDYQFHKIEEKDCILGKHLKYILSKPVKTDLDSAIIEYARNPINKDGFKSIPFKQFPCSKKKVLLLGDSFTWGHSAEPLGNSFADYLLSKGFVVYNTGISGSDPEQYRAVAEKYISILEPDYVVVNFYIGNDVQYFRRKLLPNIPIFYSSNAGNILSCPEGVTFLDAKESYDFAKSRITIPQSSLFNRICSYTALGTLIWKFVNKIGWSSQEHPKYSAIYAEQRKLRQLKPSCNEITNEILALAKQHDASFFLISIPNVESGKIFRAKDVQYLFEGISYYEAPVGKGDFHETNFHYNNQGHLKHGKFIEELINKAAAVKPAF
jgi:hypothetical protein